MLLCAVVAQVPVAAKVETNVVVVLETLGAARSADLVLFPEGMLSGYSSDLSWLDTTDSTAIDAALEEVTAAATDAGVSVWLGTLAFRRGSWRNLAVGVDAAGRRFSYEKVNLASAERGLLAAGDELPVFDVDVQGLQVRLAVQICRELRHPEQWRVLARGKAAVFLHLNNALAPAPPNVDTWRSMLISRAAENQRFVLSANAAGAYQRAPSIVVSPTGDVLAEASPDQKVLLEVELDLAKVSDVYLGQIRDDVVDRFGQAPARS